MCRELNFATAILFLQGRIQITIAKKKKRVNDIICSLLFEKPNTKNIA